MYRIISIVVSLVLLTTASYTQNRTDTQVPGSSLNTRSESTTRALYTGRFDTQRDSVALTRVGNWPFGKAIGVAVDTARDIVYLGSGGAVLVLDVSNLSNPQLISDDINSLGLVLDLSYNHATQNLYIAANYEDFQIWDVQNPAAPQKLSQYGVPNPYASPPTGNVDFKDQYAILENSYLGIASVDVSDPANPVVVGGSAATGNPTNEIHIAADGRLHAVGGNYYAILYINANGSLSGGAVYDLYTNDVFATTTLSFVRSNQYLYIFDVTSPLVDLLSVTSVGYFSDIYVQGNYAYIANSNQLQIWDVSSPQSPFLAGSITLPGYPERLEVIGQYAYVADGFAGLRIIDIGNPTQPFEVGYYETFGATVDMVRDGDYAYLAELDDGMLVLDLTELSDPTLIGQYDTPGNATDVKVAGDYAYVADGDSGFRIADISDPTAPSEVGFLETPYYAWRVTVSDSHAYLVDNVLNQPDWIRVIDIANPANPTEVGSILMQSEIGELDVSGNYLNLAADDLGMRVLDVSNPSSPTEVGWFIAPDVYDVAVQGNYAYLASADYDGGLLILDISTPTTPSLAGAYNPYGYLHPFDVAVEGGWACLGVPTSDKILLLYVADPELPRELGSFTPSGDISNLHALDSLIYLSDGAAGLTILENELFYSPGGGISWQPQTSGTSEDLWAVHFNDVSTGWAAGSEGTIINTDDGGETWLPQYSGTLEEFFDIFFINNNRGWAVGREGTLITTTDGGDNWQPQTSGTNAVLRSIHFADSVTGWTAGENGTILYTTDGGNNWQPQISGTNEYLLDIYFADYSHGWVAVSDYGIILKTTNGGSNWQTINIATQTRFYAVDFLDETTGWASGTDGAVFKSTDGGDTWVEQTNNPAPYAALTSVFFISANTGWSVGYDGEIISTVDGGDNWLPEISGVQDYLTCVYFVDQYNGWVSGKNGTILKAITIGLKEYDTQVTMDETGGNILYNAFPNPFGGNTTIKYSLANTAEVSLTIYNILGEEINTLVKGIQTSGVKSITWDGLDNRGNRVSSGVYFCSLETDNSVQTRKVVFMR